MKQNNKESKALYSFCPLLTADGDVRAGFLIDKTDLAKVSDRQAAILESVFTCAASSAAVKTITLSAQIESMAPLAISRRRHSLRNTTMSEHEPCIAETSEWYPPPEMFKALGLTFDLDPASPGPGHWVPVRRVYTEKDDGLTQPWDGLVFMNPPYGGRNDHVPWLRKFLKLGNGIAIVRAYTSSAWWLAHMPKAELVLFPKGKTKFIRPDGSIGKCPRHGIVFVGVGAVACEALRRCGLGMVWDRTRRGVS